MILMKRIIIADDDPAIQDVLGVVLKPTGNEATTFTGATEIFNNQFSEPDIFIIDRQLQNSDGLDVCRFLKNREQFACTPVILFSAGGKLHEMAKKAGADDFIEKPFTIKSLLQMIEKYVGK